MAIIATVCQVARVIALVFEAAQALDLVGPTTVFAAARTEGTPAYDVRYASVGGGPRRITSGLVLDTRDLLRVRLHPTDLVLVPGGDEPALLSAVADESLVRWLKKAALKVRHVVSVCSGAFVLAHAGLLDGKRATTHWRVCDRLAQHYPQVQVDPNAIYVHSGRIWTSAGVTTGIDLALALVERELGRSEADRLAKELVVYVRRPGFQSQFSEALAVQSASSAGLNAALEWAQGHLTQATVDTLAKRAGVSVRTLHRLCRDQLNSTPGRLLDRLRVEHARLLLSTSSDSLKVLAQACGFDNSTRMNRAFRRAFGVDPRAYRTLHSSSEAAAGPSPAGSR